MNEICGDSRFEIIAKAKEHLLDATNIADSEDEMKVLDSFLFRCWQMGWLDSYDEPKDEPQTCDTCKYGEDKHRYAHICNECGVGINNYEPKTEPQACDNCKLKGTTKWCDNQVVCRAYQPKYEPQTMPIKRTLKGTHGERIEYTESEMVVRDEPQTDCAWK